MAPALEGWAILEGAGAVGGVVEAIARRLAAGEALPSICRDPSLPDLASVSALMAEDGAFREAMVQARGVRAEVLADEVLDIVEQVARPSPDGDEPGGERRDSSRRAPVADKDALALAKLRIDVRKWLIARAEEEARPAGAAAEDRAALAVEALRELLSALDGKGRALPAAGEPGPGEPVEGGDRTRFREGSGACGAGPFGDAGRPRGGGGPVAPHEEVARGAGPPGEPVAGVGLTAGGVEMPSEGIQPLPAFLFLRSRARAGGERGADGGAFTGEERSPAGTRLEGDG